MINLEDLTLFDADSGKPEEYNPETFKAGLAGLENSLAASVPVEDIRRILVDLKESLRLHPQIVHELLDEDIGILTSGIRKTSDVVLVKDKAKQSKKRVKTMTTRELAEAINNPPEDF